MKRNNTLWGYLFLTPQLLGLLAFALIPLGFALVLSFTNWDGFGAKTFIGLENFIGQFNNPVFGRHYGIPYYTRFFTFLLVFLFHCSSQLP